MSYIRKYYLHHRVRSAGFNLKITKEFKTIQVKSDQTEKAKENKYISELRESYNYGVQLINPMIHQ